MRVLVVDDDDVSAAMLVNSLERFGYEISVAEDGRAAFELIRTGLYHLIVSDWEMPGMSGIELCRQIRQRPWSGYIYVILLTFARRHCQRRAGLDCRGRRFRHQAFPARGAAGAVVPANASSRLESRDLMIFALAKLAESRDPETGAHLERIREYCRILADELSHWEAYRDQIDGEYACLLYMTSPLHDIGKVGIPDAVLLKPGKLTPAEFEIMKRHTLIGGETLEAVTRAIPRRSSWPWPATSR